MHRVWSRRGKAGKTVILALVALSVFVGIALVGALTSTEDDRFVDFNTDDAGPDWSPDGRNIAFTSNRGSGGVYLIHPDGTSLRRIVRGYANDVDWSPDGNSLVFVAEGGIYLIRLGDRRPMRIIKGNSWAFPAFAPSGRALAVVRAEPDLSDAIYFVRLDGRGRHRLLPRYRGAVGDARPGSPGALSETEPGWSPDGKRIAFEAGDGVIVIADVKSGRRIKINQGAYGYSPAWSPDGRLLAYSCDPGLCIANTDASGSERHIASQVTNPSWSPDSRRLVSENVLYGGTGFGSRPRSLSIIDASGENARKLTFGPSK